MFWINELLTFGHSDNLGFSIIQDIYFSNSGKVTDSLAPSPNPITNFSYYFLIQSEDTSWQIFRPEKCGNGYIFGL